MAITPQGVMAGASLLSAAGGFLGGGSSKPHRSYRTQLRLSRDDIPLRVKAYKDAGIHPLYGMGGQQIPGPISGGGSDPGMGDRLASAGQNIARAASAYQTKEERAKADIRDNLQLEHMKLQNDLLRSQITTIGRPTTPGLPSGGSAIDGQAIGAPLGAVNFLGSDAISAAPGRQGVEAGKSPLVKEYQTGGRGSLYLPSSQASEALEGMPFPVSTVAGLDLLLRGMLPEYANDFKSWLAQTKFGKWTDRNRRYRQSIRERR